MKLRKASVALATTLAALAGVSTFDSASAQGRGSHQDRIAFGEHVALGQRVVRSNDLAAVVSDAPQELRAKRRDLVDHGTLGAASRPSKRDIAGSSRTRIDGGWGVDVDVVELRQARARNTTARSSNRTMRGDGRMNGGMGRRR
jgi:hypothetical protein